MSTKNRMQGPGLAPANVPEVMEWERDFMMFRTAGDPKLYFWFRVCPVCGLRINEPCDSPDEVRLMGFTPPGGSPPILYGLHGGCADATDGLKTSDAKAAILGLACLRAVKALERLAGVSRAAFAPGSKVAS